MSLFSIIFPTRKDFLNKEKFLILKFFQISCFFVFIIFVIHYNDKILWNSDLLGKIADFHKLFITAIACFVVIVDPLFNFNQYIKLNESENLFFEILEANFKNITDKQKIHKKIIFKFKKIILCFLLFYIICDTRLLTISLRVLQTRNIYFLSMSTTVFLYMKVAHLVFQMLTINTFLENLHKVIKSMQEELDCAEKLKSRIYDKIVENKYLKIIELYACIEKITVTFNQIGFTQFLIFQSLKFYMTSDFFWICLVTMHSRIKLKATFGEIFKKHLKF